jgi:outer membrane protein OmpA-like peptidoglycan-associated protein
MRSKDNLLVVSLLGGAALAGAVLALGAGCSTPSSQLNSCQADKDQLLATIRDQRDAIRTKDERLAVLEKNLGEAEKELARGNTGTRISSRPPSNRPTSSAAPLRSTTSPASQLPWRAPNSGSAPSPSDKSAPAASPPQSRSGGRGSSSGVSLASLAEQDEQLSYDQATNTARLEMSIPFAENSAALSAESRRQLDDVARWLKPRDRAGLKVLVSGYAAGRPPRTAGSGDERYASARQLAAARAQAVADYLDSHGIAEERLAVVGGGTPVADDAGNGANASGVQIVLAEPDTPLIGWASEGRSLRR